MAEKSEQWGSRLGVIMAVAGSAVGLGNFLRFPGLVAEYGGGSFMIAYLISLMIIGLPISWTEWAMGRMGGLMGWNAAPGIWQAITGSKAFRWVGVLSVIIPVCIFTYYVFIEAWCLGYACNFLMGNLDFRSTSDSGAFFQAFTGQNANGSAFGFGLHQVGLYFVVTFALNYWIIFKGISGGIELCCKLSMPALMLMAVIVMIRVLTLGTPDASKPENSVSEGMGFMWNPQRLVVEAPAENGGWKTVARPANETSAASWRQRAAAGEPLRVRTVTLGEQLLNPQLWLAAAGQILFSLSIGFGVIINYASYLKKQDDVVLSGLTAASANEFNEVCLGGLISIPAGVAFLGVVGIAGMGTFGLGFVVLPLVFEQMPGGTFFGFLFFSLLFLAALTSSISMLQPGIAALEEALPLKRIQSSGILAVITLAGSLLVVFFTQDLRILDTLDFWVGTFLIFCLATLQIVVFGWKIGLQKGLDSAHEGAAMKIPKVFNPVIRYVTPLFLLGIFTLWLATQVFGFNLQTGVSGGYSSYIRDLFIEPHPVSWIAIGIMIATIAVFAGIAASSPRYRKD